MQSILKIQCGGFEWHLVPLQTGREMSYIISIVVPSQNTDKVGYLKYGADCVTFMLETFQRLDMCLRMKFKVPIFTPWAPAAQALAFASALALNSSFAQTTTNHLSNDSSFRLLCFGMCLLPRMFSPPDT